MQRFLRNIGPGSRAAEASRKQLIGREMRFVLQQDVRRFTQQILARLLAEGCNLNPALAKIRFYEGFVRRLAADLPADSRSRFLEKTPSAVGKDTHRRFHAAVKHFLAQAPDAETLMAATVLDVIEALKLDWQYMAKKGLSNESPGETDLQNLVEQISRANSDGHLAQHDLDEIRHRLRIAVVTSLMRHVRRTDLLREKFGSIPQILRRLRRNPIIFAALIATFKKQIPYAEHVIAQSFWRTLNNMDTELPDSDHFNLKK
jgi:hypothetical protein